MPDDRTQDALDALADLFLTGLVPSVPSPRDESDADRARRRAARRAPADARLEGPAPIRLGPKVRTAPNPAPGVVADATTPAPNSPDPYELIDRAASALAAAERDLLESESEPADTPPPTATPYLRLRRDDESPTGLVASPTTRSTPDSNDTPDQPLDSEPAAPVSVLLEAVLLGNLPGFGGAWLTQYAGLLAAQDGPVAILHVDDDTIDLELVEPYDDAGTSTPIPETSGAGLVALLDALTRRAAQPVRTVLIHHDASATGLAEGGIERLLTVDAWTVLAGTDSMAVASVGQMLTRLADADASAAQQRIGLMVMGSDEDASREAGQRVRDAVGDRFLQSVELVGWQKRMTPVSTRELGSFTDLATLWPALEAWFDTLVQPELEPVAEIIPVKSAKPAGEAPSLRGSAGSLEPKIKTTTPPRPVRRPASKPPTPTAATPATGTPPRRELTGWRRELADEIAAGKTAKPAPAGVASATTQAAPERPAPIPTPAKPATESQPGASPRGSTATAPKPAPTQPAAPAPLPIPDLAALLTTSPLGIPGGVALEARCPHQPNTQLLLDQQGVLHLLHRAKPTTPAPTADDAAAPDLGVDALRASIVDLLETRGWVAQHLALIQLTQRQLRIDPDHTPALHLFTDRADLAVPLSHRLGPLLKLHLLQPVHVGSQSTWFTTPLG